MGTAFVLSSAVGILLGLYAGTRKDSIADRDRGDFLDPRLLDAGVLPRALLVLTVFALYLGWFPTQGMYDIRNPREGWGAGPGRRAPSRAAGHHLQRLPARAPSSGSPG